MFNRIYWVLFARIVETNLFLLLFHHSGLLKDYLRELPEPLFNKAMFDMMDDGLSVCVPDDPTGNAKLMFSILECLTKANRVGLRLFEVHVLMFPSLCTEHCPLHDGPHQADPLER